MVKRLIVRKVRNPVKLERNRKDDMESPAKQPKKVSKLVGDRGNKEAEKTPWEEVEEAKQAKEWIEGLGD